MVLLKGPELKLVVRAQPSNNKLFENCEITD
jgi:hypothetical protein